MPHSVKVRQLCRNISVTIYQRCSADIRKKQKSGKIELDEFEISASGADWSNRPKILSPGSSVFLS